MSVVTSSEFVFAVSCVYLDNRKREYSQVEGVSLSLESAHELADSIIAEDNQVRRVFITQCKPNERWLIDECAENTVNTIEAQQDN